MTQAWEVLLHQQWAHSMSGDEALRVLNLSHYFGGCSLMNSLHQFVPCLASPLCFLQYLIWRTPLKWGMRHNEATYKINQIWHKNWCGMQSRWHVIHLLGIEFFVYCLQNLRRQGATPGVIFQNEDWRDRKQLLRRVGTLFKWTNILIGWCCCCCCYLVIRSV